MWPIRDDRQDRFLAQLNTVQPRLLSFCRHASREQRDLEDTVQSVLLTAYERFEDFQPGTNFHAWIFRIATNVIFNANRRASRQADRATDVDPAELDVIAELQREYAYDELLSDPDRILDEVGDEIAVALRDLTERELSVFLLKSICDMRCREIADILQMPIGSVMGYLARARGKLRANLAEHAKKFGFLGSDVKHENTNGLPNS
jgi:RNA polymerase sigma-70 factor (ECF subfamily)